MQTAQFFSLVTVSRGAFVDMIATRYAATRSSSSALEHLLRTSAANVVRARGVAYSASNRRPLASHNSSETAWRCSKCRFAVTLWLCCIKRRERRYEYHRIAMSPISLVDGWWHVRRKGCRHAVPSWHVALGSWRAAPSLSLANLDTLITVHYQPADHSIYQPCQVAFPQEQ